MLIWFKLSVFLFPFTLEPTRCEHTNHACTNSSACARMNAQHVLFRAVQPTPTSAQAQNDCVPTYADIRAKEYRNPTAGLDPTLNHCNSPSLPPRSSYCRTLAQVEISLSAPLVHFKNTAERSIFKRKKTASMRGKSLHRVGTSNKCCANTFAESAST